MIETNLRRLIDKWEEINYSQLFDNESSGVILNMSNYYSNETHHDQINEACRVACYHKMVEENTGGTIIPLTAFQTTNTVKMPEVISVDKDGAQLRLMTIPSPASIMRLQLVKNEDLSIEEFRFFEDKASFGYEGFRLGDEVELKAMKGVKMQKYFSVLANIISMEIQIAKFSFSPQVAMDLDDSMIGGLPYY